MSQATALVLVVRNRGLLVLHPNDLDLACERVVPRIVVIRHRRIGVHADIGGFAG
jgi:hypothetical protein